MEIILEFNYFLGERGERGERGDKGESGDKVGL